MTTKSTLMLTLLSILVFSGCEANLPEEQSVSDPNPETLSTQEILDLAYLDELKAESTYAFVIEQFGEEKPFTNIIHAEVKHSQSILNLYESFGLLAPEFEGSPEPEVSSIQDACSAGVIAEKENIELYDELMAQTSEQNIISVFQNLQRASREKHLPAFERCSK